MEEVAQRIKELIDRQNLSNSEFAKRIDINPSIISHILSGRNKPSLQLIDAIKASFTNVNLDYLISGKGLLFNDITNVKKEENSPEEPKSNPELPLDNIMSFPMEGVRHASIPGSQEHLKKKTEEEKNSGQEHVKEEYAPSPPYIPQSDKASTNDKEIEQIVIFYTDGSFKAYKK